MKTTDDISSMLKDLFGETIQEMMEAEMDTTLGYGKNDTGAKDVFGKIKMLKMAAKICIGYLPAN